MLNKALKLVEVLQKIKAMLDHAKKIFETND